jgi:hypothetical protein
MQRRATVQINSPHWIAATASRLLATGAIDIAMNIATASSSKAITMSSASMRISVIGANAVFEADGPRDHCARIVERGAALKQLMRANNDMNAEKLTNITRTIESAE